MIDLTISVGATAGLGGNPLYLELISLLVNNKDKSLDVAYYEYTLIDNVRVNEKIYSYSLRDGYIQATKDGLQIQKKDAQGNLVFKTDAEGNFELDAEGNQVPSYTLTQFTDWVSAFKPYIWDAPSVLKDGIKQHYGI
jgi:hypothetical protein